MVKRQNSEKTTAVITEVDVQIVAAFEDGSTAKFSCHGNILLGDEANDMWRRAIESFHRVAVANGTILVSATLTRNIL